MIEWILIAICFYFSLVVLILMETQSESEILWMIKIEEKLSICNNKCLIWIAHCLLIKRQPNCSEKTESKSIFRRREREEKRNYFGGDA